MVKLTPKKKQPVRYFTEKEIKRVVELWSSATLQEIADDLGRPKYAISYLANAMRKEGVKLPRKRSVGQLQVMIRRIAQEMNLPKT